MRWVQQAAIRPHRCAVIPFIGNSNSTRGFIDTGQELRERDQVYVSVEAVEQMAAMIGWVSSGRAQADEAKIKRLEAEVRQLEIQVEEADRFAEAAEYTMARFGSKVRAKPGRKAAA